MRAPNFIRGCFDMPHVGPHPGTGLLAILVISGGFAGALRGGIFGMLGGAAFMLACMLPMYLMGAHDRAELSDRLVKKRGKDDAQ